jgi:hypothetical protein
MCLAACAAHDRSAAFTPLRWANLLALGVHHGSNFRAVKRRKRRARLALNTYMVQFLIENPVFAGLSQSEVQKVVQKWFPKLYKAQP